MRKNSVVALLVDVNNLQYGSRHRYNTDVDYRKLCAYVTEKSGEIVKSIAYGCNENDHLKPVLKELGFELKWNFTRRNWNVVLALDAVRQSDRVDNIVIASSDPNVGPIHEYIKHEGLVSLAIGFNISECLKAASSRWYQVPRAIMLDDPTNVS